MVSWSTSIREYRAHCRYLREMVVGPQGKARHGGPDRGDRAPEFDDAIEPYHGVVCQIIDGLDCLAQQSSGTKHAVGSMMEGLRQEHYEIRATLISPGVVAIELTHDITDAKGAAASMG